MPDRSRILYLYPSPHFNTGSPKALVQFIDVLDRNIFAPVYCATGTGALTDELTARAVEIVPWSLGTLCAHRPLAALRAIYHQVELLKQLKIDLVHANCFPWNTDLIIAAGMIGIPVVLHVHCRMDVPFRNLNRLFARKVLFCSRAVFQNCGGVGRVASKASVFYNIIDVDRWAKGRSIRSQLGIREGELAIGTVAQIVHGKGIDILLEAAKLLLRERADLVFFVVGPQIDREEEFGRRMLAAAEQGELAGHVRFLGSRADIADFMASVDLFVLPTRADALPIVILEAMAAGVPVIASNVGGIPEMITSHEVGSLVDRLTPEAFAQAIREVMSRPDRGRSMAAKAQSSLQGRFDIDTGRRQLNGLYLDLLGAKIK